MIELFPFEILVNIFMFVFDKEPKWKNVFMMRQVSTSFNETIRFVCEHHWNIVIPNRMILIHLDNGEPHRRPIRRLWVDENIQLWQSVAIILRNYKFQIGRRLSCPLLLKSSNDEFCFFETNDEIPPVTFAQYFGLNPNDSKLPTMITYQYCRKKLGVHSSVVDDYFVRIRNSTILTITRPRYYLFLKHNVT
jgi:hypothetical protein